MTEVPGRVLSSWALVGVALLGFPLARPVEAGIQVTVIGGFSETVDSSSLVGGAGSNLQPSYTSAVGASTLDVSGTTGSADAWRIDVRRVDSSWDPSLALKVRRSSDGSVCAGEPLGSEINGGVTNLLITTVDTTFFSGRGSRCSIALVYELDGVSIQIPPGAYSTSITFTVVDL
jgi:hypothetical protein